MHIAMAQKVLTNDYQIYAAHISEQRILSFLDWYKPNLSNIGPHQQSYGTVPTLHPTPAKHAPGSNSPYRPDEDSMDDKTKMQRKALRNAERLRPMILRFDATAALYTSARSLVTTDLIDLQRQYPFNGPSAHPSHSSETTYARILALERVLEVLDTDMRNVRDVRDAARLAIASDPASRAAAQAASVAFEGAWRWVGGEAVLVDRFVGGGLAGGSREVWGYGKREMDVRFEGFVGEACRRHAVKKGIGRGAVA